MQFLCFFHTHIWSYEYDIRISEFSYAVISEVCLWNWEPGNWTESKNKYRYE